MRRARWPILIAMLSACSAVQDSNPDFGSAIADETSAAGALAAASIEADQFCVIEPYSDDAAIAETIGFDWPGAAEQTGIGTTDGKELVVATEDDRVVAWAMVPRGLGTNLTDDGYGCLPVESE